MERYRERESITIDPRESSLVVRLAVQDSGEQISLFFVSKNGWLSVWPATIANQLRRAGLDSDLAKFYDVRLRDVLNMDERSKEIWCPVVELPLGRFLSTVDDLIEEVQRAEPVDR